MDIFLECNMDKKSNLTKFIKIGMLVFIIFQISSIGIPQSLAWNNCPFGVVNDSYPGLCGRYIDTDNDQICDLSQSPPEIRAESSLSKNNGSQKVNSNSFVGIEYNFIPITILLIGLYVIGLILVHKKFLAKAQYKKFWNVILLITFLISGLFGILLVLRLSFNLKIPYYTDILFWHVEMGIAMTLISIFHIIWHWKYFKKMLIH
jgi:hypothetical protein